MPRGKKALEPELTETEKRKLAEWMHDITFMPAHDIKDKYKGYLDEQRNHQPNE